MKRGRAACLVALAMVSLAADAGIAPDPKEQWIRAGGPHVVLYSNARRADVDGVSRGLEAFVQVLTQFVGEPAIGHRDPCTTIFLYKDRRSLESLLGQVMPEASSSRGFFVGTSGTTYLVSHLSDEGADVSRDIVRSYLRAHRPLTPPWLETGLIETLGTFRDDGSRIVGGLVRREYFRHLLSAPLVDLETLLTITDAKAYEAMSWGLTQFVLFETPAQPEAVRRYLDLTAKGGDPIRSFEEALGSDLKSVGDSFRLWVSRRRVTPYERPLAEATWVPREATRSEVLLHFGNLVLHDNRAAAIELYREAVAGDSTNVEARAMLGIALKESGRPEEAIEHLDAATRASVKHPAAYLVHAEILLDRVRGAVRFGATDPPPAAVLQARALLMAGIAIDPTVSAAWAALGKTWVYDHTGFDEGIAASERSLALDPRSEDAALSLVLLHLKKNDYDRAAKTLDERLRPVARDGTIDVAERGMIAWQLHRANALARAGNLAAAKALVASVMEVASDEKLRKRLALDMDQIELTSETVRLTEVYNRAVSAVNDFRYETALTLADQILREARDPALRRDTEEMKRTIEKFLRRR